MNQNPETVLERAKALERQARAAESIRISMRLRDTILAKDDTPVPPVRRPFLATFKNVFHGPSRQHPNGHHTKDWVPLTADEHAALYDALAIVRNDAEREAARLRAMVQVVPEP